METYQELKKRHRDEFDAFEGIFFAFSNEQFKEGMLKVGLAETETDKIYRLPGGGFILKTRSAALDEIFKRHEQERKEHRKAEKNLFESLVYELRNHEYCITYDPQDALNALGIGRDEVPEALLKKACKEAVEVF